MSRSRRVQAALKEAQKNRIDAKGKKGYVDSTDKQGRITSLGYLSSQPMQKLMAATNEEVRSAHAEHALAIEDLQVAQITGVDLQAKQEAAAITALVVQNLQDSKQRRSGVSLSSVGSL